MGLTKHAGFQVLSARLATEGSPLMRTAHRHEFEYAPRQGYLYVRSRMISSRTNDNYDEFPGEEIKKAYRTFIGKPVFVNHHNDNHRRARGVIKDAVLHEDVNPDGSPDIWVEGLMEVDAIRFPKLAKAILAGEIDRTSMGTDVAYSECTFCGNRASTPLEYCKHIPKMKGQRIYRTTASGSREGVLVAERCFGLGFFENSLLVEEPADPTAYFLGVDARGLGKAASLDTTAGPKVPMVPGHSVRTDQAPDGTWFATCECGRPFSNRATAQEAWVDSLSHATKGNPAYDDHDVDEAERRLHRAPPPGPKAIERIPQHMERDPASPRQWQLAASLRAEAREYGFDEDDDGDPDDLLNRRRRTDSNDIDADYLTHRDQVCPGGNRLADAGDPGECGACGFQYSPGAAVVPSHLRPRPGKTGSTVGYDLTLSCGDPVKYVGSQGGQVAKGDSWTCKEHGSTTVAEVKGSGATTNGLGMDRSASKTALAPGAQNEHVVAPADVDTLRDEQCPVCGEQDSFDGDKCQVCQFVAPPSEFGEPDLEKAQQTDLRQQQDDANDDGGDLKCDKCSATFSSTPATAQAPAKKAVVLDPDASPEGEGEQSADVAAKVGDTCPSCGDGTLQPSGGAPEADGFAPAGSGGADEAADGPPEPEGDEEDDADDEDESDGADDQDGEDGDKPDFVKKKQDSKKASADRRGSTSRRSSDALTSGDAAPRTAASARAGDRMPAVAGVRPAQRLPGFGSSARLDQGARTDPSRVAGGPRLVSGVSVEALHRAGAPGGRPSAGEPAPSTGGQRARGPVRSGAPVHAGEHPGAREAALLPHLPHLSEAVPLASRGASRTTHEGADVMRPALQALAAQQKQIEAQQGEIAVLRGAVAFIAEVAGLDKHEKIAAFINKTAVDDNPAFGGGWDNGAPVEGSPEAPSQSTQEAATPQAKDDVQSPGATPLTDVSPDAQDSLDNTSVVLDVTEPQEVDVTAPIAGTDTLGKGERGQAGTNRIETEIRTGTPHDESAAFRDGGFLGAKSEARTIASLRLARLQITAGIASGDDLDLSQVIASSGASDEAIAAEIATLSKVVTAGRTQPVARNLVPRSASQAQRTLPSMTASVEAPQQEIVGSVSSDEMLFE